MGRKIGYLILLSLFIFMSGGCRKKRPRPVQPTPPAKVNHSPVLVLSATQISVLKGEQVVLDASGSYDPDGDTLYYQWSDLDGLFEGQNVNFSYPAITGTADKLGEFHFKVEVFDLHGGAVTGEVVVNVGRTYSPASYTVYLTLPGGVPLPDILDPSGSVVDLKVVVEDPDFDKYGDQITCTYNFAMSGVTEEVNGYMRFGHGITEVTLNSLRLDFGSEGKVRFSLTCVEPAEGGVKRYSYEKDFYIFKLLSNGEPEAIFVSSGKEAPAGKVDTCYDESVTDGSKWGTPVYPYHCITSAIERMKNETERKKIYIAEGFYNEQVVVDTPFELITGGFRSDWSKDESARPVIYYDPGYDIPQNDYSTPDFQTFTMAFIYDGSLSSSGSGTAKVEKLAILPSRKNVIGVSTALLLDSGTPYDDSTNAASDYVADLFFDQCEFPAALTSGATVYPEKVTIVEGLQGKRIWFNRIYVSDYRSMGAGEEYFSRELTKSVQKFYFMNLNPGEAHAMVRFSNFGISNSILDMKSLSGKIIDTRHSPYPYIDGYVWILYNTIILRSRNNIVFDLPLWRYTSSYGKWLYFTGNIVEPGPDSSVFVYPYQQSFAENYLFMDGDTSDGGPGSVMFNLFVMGNGSIYVKFSDKSAATLKEFDVDLNNNSGADAESRYNSAVTEGGLKLLLDYSYEDTTATGVDGGYIPSADYLGLTSSGLWGGDPDFIDAVSGYDFYGGMRSVNIVGIHTCNDDYTGNAYRDDDCYRSGKYRQLYWISGDTYSTEWSFTDESLLPTDIGAVELQR